MGGTTGKARRGVAPRGAAHALLSLGKTGSSDGAGERPGPGTYLGAVGTPDVMALDVADAPVRGGLAWGDDLGDSGDDENDNWMIK